MRPGCPRSDRRGQRAARAERRGPAGTPQVRYAHHSLSPTTIPRWVYLFPSAHRSQAALGVVSTWMGDRLGTPHVVGLTNLFGASPFIFELRSPENRSEADSPLPLYREGDHTYATTRGRGGARHGGEKHGQARRDAARRRARHPTRQGARRGTRPPERERQTDRHDVSGVAHGNRTRARDTPDKPL